nr:DUF6436 domain-containing protein [Marinifaba aquimaris]
MCSRLTQTQRGKIDQLAQEQGTIVQTLSLSEQPWLRFWLPSTPAIVMFDETEKLVYLGPYSEGWLCNSANSLVESLLPRLSKTVGSIAIVHSQAKGCYCSANSS